MILIMALRRKDPTGDGENVGMEMQRRRGRTAATPERNRPS
jgi:hypothetical protein